MATANQRYRFAGQRVVVAMPATGETVNGECFTVPPGNKTVTVYVPALAGTGTVKLEGLVPNDGVETTQTWRALTYFDIADGTFDALDGLPESTAVTMPCSLMGGGILRWVASEDNSGAVVDVIMLFTRDG